MQFHEQEVTLKLNSRPLHLVYLVRNREDLINAVTLYTHVWGGAANAIFPMPENEAEVDTLKCALESINPDYVLAPAPTEGIPSGVIQVLEQLPVNHHSVSTRDIEQYINERRISDYNLFRLQTGTLATGVNHARLSHIASILQRLYPTPLTDSIIRLIEPGSLFDFELALQTGIPSQTYQNFLREHFGATILPSPQNPTQLIKYSLLMAGTPRYKNPASLTLLEVKQLPLEVSPFQNVDEKLFHLFLSDGEDISLASAFWNSRCFSLWHNKLFLPKEAFLSNLEHHVALILEVMPSIEILFVTTPLDEDGARALGHELKNALAAVGRDIPVQVTYGNFRFNFLKGATSWGQPETMTRTVTSDGSIRFSPPVPLRHENTDFFFGYDAEVTFASGRKFFMPATKSGAILLSYQLERIKYAEVHQDPNEIKYLRGNSPVRAGFKGITGTALAGKECRAYIPTDEAVIERRIKDADLIVKFDEHTCYARGCIRCCGGFEETTRLIDKHGADIISALVYQGGEWNTILRFLGQQRRWTNQEKRELLPQKLQLLLTSKLVYREYSQDGYNLKCPTCNLEDWYSRGEIGESIECQGCGDRFQPPLREIPGIYKPNTLLTQFVENGGLAVLMTANILYQITFNQKAFKEFGGKLFHFDERDNFAEIDLFWLIKEVFILAECKSINKIDDKEKLDEKINGIKEQLERYIKAATELDAQVVILGVVTDIPNLHQSLLSAVADIVETAKEKCIGVHLILNWKLYLWGTEEVAELWRITLNHLKVIETHTEPNQSVIVGQMPQQIRGLSGELFNHEVLQRWEQK
ncbi:MULTISPECIES: hypothetical protein [unclassified Coleofasciculus]|uniref:hypothetical protein n=1 Tax=unclassified Coleofasciculus TaxID=2692782 RepID=UPI00188025AD|nr:MULTISPECIES: hypothetical protein [unclassified Coleofasciculus]MBE9127150.1 hypothetical protein [Coleofasciculus sp. LEGE 07081]MBE9150287.1 hypothetical protein [Coleofasciculus sp. LEGE 07092]